MEIGFGKEFLFIICQCFFSFTFFSYNLQLEKGMAIHLHKLVYPFSKNTSFKFCWQWSFCLFVWSLSSHSRIFHSYGAVTITIEGLQILIFARQSWPLTSEGSLVCHTYCDIRHSFILVISEDPWHSHLLPCV